MGQCIPVVLFQMLASLLFCAVCGLVGLWRCWRGWEWGFHRHASWRGLLRTFYLDSGDLWLGMIAFWRRRRLSFRVGAVFRQVEQNNGTWFLCWQSSTIVLFNILTDLCCLLLILVWPFFLSPGSPFIGFFRSSVRRWPETRATQKRRQNKVEDSILLFKADNFHRQDKINDWWNRRRAGEQDLHIYIIN